MSLITRTNPAAAASLAASHDKSWVERAWSTNKVFGVFVALLTNVIGLANYFYNRSNSPTFDSLVKDFAKKSVEVKNFNDLERNTRVMLPLDIYNKGIAASAELSRMAAPLEGRVVNLTNGADAEVARDIITEARRQIEQGVLQNGGSVTGAKGLSTIFHGSVGERVVQASYAQIGGTSMTAEGYGETIQRLVDMGLYATPAKAQDAFKEFASTEFKGMTKKEYAAHIKALGASLKERVKAAKGEQFEKAKVTAEERAAFNAQIREKNVEMKALRKDIAKLQPKVDAHRAGLDQAIANLAALSGRIATLERVKPRTAEQIERHAAYKAEQEQARAMRLSQFTARQAELIEKQDALAGLEEEVAAIALKRDGKDTEFNGFRRLFTSLNPFAGEPKHKFPSSVSKVRVNDGQLRTVAQRQIDADKKLAADLRRHTSPVELSADDRKAERIADLEVALQVAHSLAGDGSAVDAEDMAALKRANVFGTLYARCGKGSSEPSWASNHCNDSVAIVRALRGIIAGQLAVVTK